MVWKGRQKALSLRTGREIMRRGGFPLSRKHFHIVSQSKFWKLQELLPSKRAAQEAGQTALSLTTPPRSRPLGIRPATPGQTGSRSLPIKLEVAKSRAAFWREATTELLDRSLEARAIIKTTFAERFPGARR